MCCAVTDELAGDEALISSNDFETLLAAPFDVKIDVKPTEKPDWLFSKPSFLSCAQKQCAVNVVSSTNNSEPPNNSNTIKLETVLTSQEIVREEVATKFRNLQLNDTTLGYCWRALRDGNTLYELRGNNQLLYHVKVISGIKTAQLVLPLEHRY